MFGIFKRMVLFELLRIFFLCWLGLTGIILMGGLFSEATQHGLAPSQIFAIMPLLIPNTIPYTLPTTTLFATCIVYGRLAQDNEILALKAAGIQIGHVIRPALILGVLASAGTLAIYLNVIPESHWELRSRFMRDVKELLYAMLRKNGCITHPQIPYHIWVQRIENETLIDTLIYRRNAKTGNYDFSVRAEEATIDFDSVKKQIIVHLKRGNMIGPDGDKGDSGPLTQIPIDIPPGLDNPRKTRATDMTWNEIFSNIQKIDDDIDETQANLAEWQRRSIDNPNEHHVGQIDHFEKVLHFKRLERSEHVTELHMRPALALGCLCFVLVGCPVGIWFSKSDYLSAFITCFLPIVAIYYPLMLCGINLAKKGKLEPWLIIWPANVLLALTALILFRKLARN
jgi:lipopolysaccharide export system permease protein